VSTPPSAPAAKALTEARLAAAIRANAIDFVFMIKVRLELIDILAKVGIVHSHPSSLSEPSSVSSE
jgi:proteasome lid subunit RPN8/RPN11